MEQKLIYNLNTHWKCNSLFQDLEIVNAFQPSVMFLGKESVFGFRLCREMGLRCETEGKQMSKLWETILT